MLGRGQETSTSMECCDLVWSGTSLVISKISLLPAWPVKLFWHLGMTVTVGLHFLAYHRTLLSTPTVPLWSVFWYTCVVWQARLITEVSVLMTHPTLAPSVAMRVNFQLSEVHVQVQWKYLEGSGGSVWVENKIINKQRKFDAQLKCFFFI